MVKAIFLSMSDIPELFGLILAGGISSRMGKDKNLIYYKDQPHAQWTYQLLSPLVNRCFFSISKSQNIPDFEYIIDEKEDLGPISGLHSAFKAYPKKAFLVIANDLPFISIDLIKRLILSRDSTRFATAFKDPLKSFAEPLLCIWEPKSFDAIMDSIHQKKYSLVDIMSTMDVKEIPIDSSLLYNANTAEESNAAKQIIRDKEGN